MSFSEIFKKTFLEGYQPADINTVFVITTLAITALISCYIFLIYRLTTRKIFYSLSFNISLVATSLITASIIFTVQSSIVISLGMVGALSIVRFRTAIKDPRDTIYIFWAVAVGVCCGVSNYLIALIGTVFIILFLVLFGFVRDVNRMLIIVRGNSTSIAEASEAIDAFLNHKGVRRVYNFDADGNSEVIYEVNENYLKKCEKKNGSIESQITSISGVKNASIICQEDEITS